MERMRRAFVVGLAALVTLVLGIALYRHFRIASIDVERPAQSAMVMEVGTPECRLELNLSSDRAVVLRAGPNVSSVTINTENVPFPELQQILSDILRTRMNRVIYVLDSQDPDSLVLEKIVAQMPEVSRICVIDSRHPPSWYPPKRKPFPGASGGGLVAGFRHE